MKIKRDNIQAKLTFKSLIQHFLDVRVQNEMQKQTLNNWMSASTLKISLCLKQTNKHQAQQNVKRLITPFNDG
jgi:hypothetical protein